MPRIGRFPPFGKRFFRQARKTIGCCHFAHFWRAVTALAAMQGRRSLKKLEDACRNHTSRQSIGFFLTKAHWDAPQLLAETAINTLKTLGWKAGQTVNVIFDDTQKKKRGKQMDALSKIFLHAEKVYAQGHTILGCAIVYRDTVIPFAARLWVPKSFAQQTQQADYNGEPLEYRKLTELGRVKLVFSRRRREKSWICMATNETRWGVVRVLSEYLKRWPIEVLFKESKQYLGLGDYQVLRYRGIERYLCLVLIAHLLLTHLGATAAGAQAEPDKTKPLDLPSVPQLQSLLRNKLWDDTIDSLEKGTRNRRVGKKLKNLIQL